jgi:hypothetical protein
MFEQSQVHGCGKPRCTAGYAVAIPCHITGSGAVRARVLRFDAILGALANVERYRDLDVPGTRVRRSMILRQEERQRKGA